MYLPEIEIVVSVARSERRTYTDRSTNQTREYLSNILSGITEDFSTMVSLRVPDNLAPFLSTLTSGSHVRVRLDYFDARRGGVVEGNVKEFVPYA